MFARRECAVPEALRVDASIDPYSVGADSISARGALPLPQVRPFRKRNFAFWQRAGHVRPLPGGTLLKDRFRKFSPHPALRATFSLRAKSRLRRLRSDTRLRAQPLGGKALGSHSSFAQP